ncbi:Hypothetical protein A7982_06655 [Minicystis rosea]|nr:Hypothetical protein A7982_06655 [Minicystis rosea]
MKLASIRLVTQDVPALASFYESVTGVAPSVPFGSGADYVELRLSGATLAIVSAASVERFNRGAAVAGANRSAVVELEVDSVAEVDALRARIAAHVTDWIQEPTDQPWGNRSMLFRDPDGTPINIYAVRARG